jgi:probable rRNA maturation factor
MKMPGGEEVMTSENQAVEVSIACMFDAWEEIPGVEEAVDTAVRAAVAAVGEGNEVELSFALVSDEQIREMNRTFRGQDKPTNVLSFPNGMMLTGGTGRVLLGDVAIALETVLAEARLGEKTPLDHLSHLTVHGVLHLFGYDHETDAEAGRMEDLERTILRGLGISDPYGPPADAAEAA